MADDEARGRLNLVGLRRATKLYPTSLEDEAPPNDLIARSRTR